jgi:MFS family permease
VLAVFHVAPSAPRGRDRGPLDIAGAGALMGGLVSLVLAIDGASRSGWTSAATLGLAATAAALLGAFAAIERRAPRPLVPASTWRTRSLVSSAAVMLAATGILVGAFFLNTLLLQHALGASPLETGLAFLPLTLVILAGAHAAQRLVAKAGTRPVMTGGLALAAAGALLLSGAPDDASYLADLLPGFLALGLGIGMTFVSVSIAAMADVGHEDAGLASGLMTTAHELGAALGVAVLAAIVTASDGLGAGYRDAFLVAGIVAAAVAAVTAFAVPSVRPVPGMAHSMH